MGVSCFCYASSYDIVILWVFDIPIYSTKYAELLRASSVRISEYLSHYPGRGCLFVNTIILYFIFPSGEAFPLMFILESWVELCVEYNIKNSAEISRTGFKFWTKLPTCPTPCIFSENFSFPCSPVFHRLHYSFTTFLRLFYGFSPYMD